MNLLIDYNKESPTLLRDEASLYFNVTRVESMTSGVKSVQHQYSMHDYNVLLYPLTLPSIF